MATALIEREPLTNEERRERVNAATKVHKRALEELARLDTAWQEANKAALDMATVFLDANVDVVEEARAEIYKQRRVVEAARSALDEQQRVEIEAWNDLCIARIR